MGQDGSAPIPPPRPSGSHIPATPQGQPPSGPPKRDDPFERFMKDAGGAISVFAVGVAAFVVGAHELWTDSASVETTCTVLEASHRRGKNKRVPQVKVAHEVDGQRYERVDEGAQRTTREVEATLAQFSPGATVPCRYVAGRPDVVVVFEERRSWGFMLGVGVVVMLLAVVGYFGTRESSKS